MRAVYTNVPVEEEEKDIFELILEECYDDLEYEDEEDEC